MTLDEKVCDVSEKLMPVIRKMVKAEAAKIAARPPSVQVKMDRIEAEIMRASADVAAAVDQLRQAQFAGGPEVPARRKLEQAAERLQRVMKKHGRV